jgi:hypothetical protein
LDELSNITDETLNKRKEFIPVAEAIIEEIKSAFLAWLEYRKFAPTIKALKEKLNVFAEAEIDVQRKKLEDFNKTQADLISAQIVQKITNHFAHHLKQEASSGKKSLELDSGNLSTRLIIMSKTIRIGTRDSQLALWQAKTVQEQLEHLGHKTKLVPVKSTGDLMLNQPIYELGITGVFTRTLDIALLNEEIDIAVHSLKDVPTLLPKGIVQAAVLKRGNVRDTLVFKKNEEFLAQENAIIATGSLRRKAQWLNRYATHTLVGLRGNVNTRLQKLENNSDWNGAIFAAAGLGRIGLTPQNAVNLEWMVPAPAQGAIMIACLESG